MRAGGRSADMSSQLDSALRPPYGRTWCPNPAPGETYGKLLRVLDQLASEAERLGDDAIREWTELAQLDAIDFGEQLGLMSDVEAASRRAAVRPGDQDQRSAAGRR
jgi:hypothetical protein